MPDSGEMITQSFRAAAAEFERAWWATLLEQCGGNAQKAAKLGGVNRTAIYRLLRRLGVHFKMKRPHRGNWGNL